MLPQLLLLHKLCHCRRLHSVKQRNDSIKRGQTFLVANINQNQLSSLGFPRRVSFQKNNFSHSQVESLNVKIEKVSARKSSLRKLFQSEKRFCFPNKIEKLINNAKLRNGVSLKQHSTHDSTMNQKFSMLEVVISRLRAQVCQRGLTFVKSSTR